MCASAVTKTLRQADEETPQSPVAGGDLRNRINKSGDLRAKINSINKTSNAADDEEVGDLLVHFPRMGFRMDPI